MTQVNFREIKDGGDQKSFLPPIGKYACLMKVDAYKRDSAGSPMTGPDGKPAPHTTSAGDPMWNIELTILDGDYYFDKTLLDNLSFGEKAAGRAAGIFVRAGMMPSVEACKENPKLWPERERNFEPDELDGTLWWVTIGHEASNKESQKPFLNIGKCTCATCTAATGRNVFVNAKPEFAGYEVMTAAEAKKIRESYAARKAAPAAGGNSKADKAHVPF